MGKKSAMKTLATIIGFILACGIMAYLFAHYDQSKAIPNPRFDGAWLR